MNLCKTSTMTAMIAAGLLAMPASSNPIATNPDTSVDIFPGSTLAAGLQFGNVTLDQMNADPNVLVISYDGDDYDAPITLDPAVDFTPPANILQTVSVVNTSGTTNQHNLDAAFASSGDKPVVANGTVEIRFNTSVAAAGLMINRAAFFDQKVVVSRTGLDDVEYTVPINGTGSSFFGFTSSTADINKLTISQDSVTAFRGFDDIAFSTHPSLSQARWSCLVAAHCCSPPAAESDANS